MVLHVLEVLFIGSFTGGAYVCYGARVNNLFFLLFGGFWHWFFFWFFALRILDLSQFDNSGFELMSFH